MKRLLSIFIAITALAGSPFALAREQYPIHFVYAFRTAQEKRIAADKRLLANMDTICDWLMYYRIKNGHLPEPGAEENEAIEKLQRIIQPNPYSATGVQTKESLQPCKLVFKWDNLLNDIKRKEWQSKAPDDWQAEPGTITVIMAHREFVLVWGAGSEHRPIFDDKHKQTYLSWHDFLQ